MRKFANTTDLSIEVSEALNPKVIRIFDTSHYADDTDITNYLLEVLPVNKNTWVVFDVDKEFSLVLNASNLKYKKVSDERDLIDLPDGIYEIKQSYKPNIFTLVQFNHFRIVELLRKINTQKAKLLDDQCKLSRIEYIKQRDRLRDIEEYALAAKWMVEEEHNKVKGKELYEFATKQLEFYTNECQC